MTVTHFTCATCAKDIEHRDSLTTGYATDDAGRKHCFACCGDRDHAAMIATGRATLYLTHRRGERTGRVTNWPGTLAINCRVREGRHNIARRRYDVWFYFEGREWHGTQYGDNTQLCHCRASRAKKGRN